MVICLERCADLHMVQLMPLPLTVYCFSEIQIGFTFLVPAHPCSPGKRAVKWVCVCVCVWLMTYFICYFKLDWIPHAENLCHSLGIIGAAGFHRPNAVFLLSEHAQQCECIEWPTHCTVYVTKHCLIVIIFNTS